MPPAWGELVQLRAALAVHGGSSARPLLQLRLTARTQQPKMLTSTNLLLSNALLCSGRG